MGSDLAHVDSLHLNKISILQRLYNHKMMRVKLKVNQLLTEINQVGVTLSNHTFLFFQYVII